MVIIVAKTLAVLMTVLDQTQADVFVMDWERFEQMKLLEVNDNSQPAAANSNQQQQDPAAPGQNAAGAQGANAANNAGQPNQDGA